jgi:hypothetical protein
MGCASRLAVQAVAPVDRRSTAGEHIVSNREGCSNARRVRSVMLGIILAGSTMPIAATAGTVFTWDPAGASPSVSAPAFTADGIVGTHNLYDSGPKANPSPVLHTVHFLEQITGFTLNGVPIATPGLNGPPGAAGSYGLYLTMQTLTASIGPPNTYQYLGGQAALKLDPGNNDGAASSTPSGLTFANPAGTADDITLATGSLVSGHYTLNPAPNIRSIGNFVQTFQPAAGEGGFFVSPVSPHDMIQLIDTTAPDNIAFPPDPSDPALQFSVLNGGTAMIDFLVPEPAWILLLGSGLFGLVAIRGRNRRPR